MTTTLLVSSAINRSNISDLLNIELNNHNQVFFFGQALVSLASLSLGHKIQLHQWAQNCPTVGYCDSVVERHDCGDTQLLHWQAYGLTEFYAKLHNADALEQF